MPTNRDFTYGKDVGVANFYLSNAPTRGTPLRERDAKLANAGISRVTCGGGVGRRAGVIYAAIAEITATGSTPYRVAGALFDIDQGVIDFLLPRRVSDSSASFLYRIGVREGAIIVQGTMTYQPGAIGAETGRDRKPALDGSLGKQVPANVGRYPPVPLHTGMNVTGVQG